MGGGGTIEYSDESRVPRGVCVSVRGDLTPLVTAVVKSSAPTCCLFHCGLSRSFLCYHFIGFRGPRVAVLLTATPMRLSCVLLFIYAVRHVGYDITDYWCQTWMFQLFPVSLTYVCCCLSQNVFSRVPCILMYVTRVVSLLRPVWYSVLSGCPVCSSMPAHCLALKIRFNAFCTPLSVGRSREVWSNCRGKGTACYVATGCVPLIQVMGLTTCL
jgi:hypothetical protein